MNPASLARGAAVLAITAAVLVGCTTQPASSPTSTPTPRPTSAGSPTPATSPTPDAGVARVAAFLELLRDPEARYRVDETYELQLGADRQTTTSHADRAGADTLFVADSVSADEERHEETAIVNGTVYQRTGAGPWTVVGPQGDAGQTFPFLGPTSLVDQGRGLAGGLFLHHLGLAGPIEIEASFAESLGVTGGVTRIVEFDAYTEPDGRPVEIEYTFTITDSAGTTVGLGTYHDMFTDFGADIVVTAPPLP